MIELKVAAQIFFHRAAARCSAKTDKSDGGSVGLSVGRLLHSFVTGVLRVEAGEAGAGVARARRLTEGESGDKNGISGGGRGRPRSNSSQHTAGLLSTRAGDTADGGFNFSSVRRSVLDGVLGRVATSQAADLRRKAFDQLLSEGNSAPFLALLGVSLASGSGIITKEDEVDQICWEIKQAVGKTRLVMTNSDSAATQQNHTWSLQDFELGPPIAKGCAAVIYSARCRRGHDVSEDTAGAEFPLAIKMMFNYDAESNAATILRAMQRETVPASPGSVAVAGELGGELVHLDRHPNIVQMEAVFADQVPHLAGDVSLYGPALPARIHPGGYGRNMSLFLVMRRYELSLADYLATHRRTLTPRTSLFLLTQLMEGVAFLHSQGVAHRDLKTDNLLVSVAGGLQYPHLVITDFGCCLADPSNPLKLSYTSPDTYRGGNMALMPPEVSLARPGPFTTISYDKADLWTAASIGYQIFGGDNPFYGSQRGGGLDKRSYSVSQLPPLPSSAPSLVSRLLKACLSPQPRHRPRPRTLATVLQLQLWAPSSWAAAAPSTQDIVQWLLTLATKVLCECRWGAAGAGAQFEYQMVATFLVSTSVRDIREALAWIQDNTEE